MSIKLAVLFLLGLIVLAAAMPAENDQPEEEDSTELQDPAENAVAEDSPRKKRVYCWKYSKKQRCRRKCVYNKVKSGYKGWKKVKRCFKLCCDYLYKRKYVCGYCYRRCYKYYPKKCYWRCRPTRY